MLWKRGEAVTSHHHQHHQWHRIIIIIILESKMTADISSTLMIDVMSFDLTKKKRTRIFFA